MDTIISLIESFVAEDAAETVMVGLVGGSRDGVPRNP